MNVLVTGGAGFVGSYATRELLRVGHRPIVFDKRNDSPLLEDIKGSLTVVKGDIEDMGAMKDAVVRYSVDAVIHAGAVTSFFAESDPALAARVNCQSVVNMLEIAKSTGIRVVFVSSIDVYRKGAGRAGEGFPAEPSNITGMTKLFGEHYGNYYAQRYGIDFVAFRFPTIFGPGKNLSSPHLHAVIEAIIEGAAKGERTKVPLGDTKIACVYCKDAARALVSACGLDLKGCKIYNAGYQQPVTPKDVVREVLRIMPGAQMQVEDGSSEESTLLDCTKAEKEIGFRTEYPLGAAVQDYIKTMESMGIK